MSDREFKGGLLILGFIAVLLIALQLWMDYDYRSAQDRLSRIETEPVVIHDASSDYGTEDKTPTYKSEYKNHKLNLHSFDPNTVSSSEMQSMGMPPRLIKTIINFRNKGGRFYKKEDILKLYSFREEWYPEYAPFIHIEKSKSSKNSYAKKSYDKKEYPKYTKSKHRDPLNLNTCTAEQLDAEWGVSPKVAQNIVKYRDLLGGYHSMTQLEEVYTLPDSVLRHNTNWYVEGGIKKINLNTADFKTLNKNPYIRKARVAKSIMAYRKTHGEFRSVDELLEIKSIDRDLYNRIAPYLSTR